jgi:hypothetical protein
MLVTFALLKVSRDCSKALQLYFAWDRSAAIGAPLTVIDDRFPAVFELRRLFYPRFERLADRDRVDQGIAGFLDRVQKPNFAAFVEQAKALTRSPVIQVERVGDDGIEMPFDDALIADVDTIVVISFDSFRTTQVAGRAFILRETCVYLTPIIEFSTASKERPC